MGINLFRLLIGYLRPILPATSEKSEAFLQVEPLAWDELAQPLLDHTIAKFKPLMTRVEPAQIEAMVQWRYLTGAERLAAIGKITNRVAHDLRNPLTVVGGFARRINKKASADDPNKKYLQMIVDEVMTMESKLSEITRIQSQ